MTTGSAPCDDCGRPLGLPLVPRDDPRASLCNRCLVARYFAAERAAARRRRDYLDALVVVVVGVIIAGCLLHATR